MLAADLDSDDGWAEAVAGCDYVLHTASPFPPKQPKDPDELIVPARDGALRVIRAALDAGVGRIVMTSSVASVRGGGPPLNGSTYTEADWTDGADTSLLPYTRSKAIAEREAWKLVEEAGAEDRLAVVNPGAIIGPALSDDVSFSLQLIERLLKGMPAVPRLGFSFVDVRDVADLHVRAMEQPGGRRQALHRRRPVHVDGRRRRGARGPPRRARPQGAEADRAGSDGQGDEPVRPGGAHDRRRSRTASRVLQRTRPRPSSDGRPRPLEDSIAETGESLIEHGIVSV